MRLGASPSRKEDPTSEAQIRTFLEDDYPRVVAALTLACDSRAAAEDAVQEALARAWERMDRGIHIDSLKAWVTTVALNLTRSRLRHLMVERRKQPEMAERAFRAPGDPEDRMDVRRALAVLPRRQREVTVLRYYLDMNVTQIADALDIREGTVKTWLHRARLSLAEALADDRTENLMEEAHDAGL